jgi:hypothetical protein
LLSDPPRKKKSRMKSQLVYVTLYDEEGAESEILGVYTSLDLGKAAAVRHFKRHHPGEPNWTLDHLGAHARHDRARYLVRELELIEH